MFTPDDLWDWQVKGFGRIVGMLQGSHDDPAMSPMSDQHRKTLALYVALLEKIVRQQAERLSSGKDCEGHL